MSCHLIYCCISNPKNFDQCVLPFANDDLWHQDANDGPRNEAQGYLEGDEESYARSVSAE